MMENLELHKIIRNIFGEVRGFGVSNQLQVNCPMCQERDCLSSPDEKFNLEISCSRNVFRCWRCDDPKFSGSLGKLIRLYGTHTDYELYKIYKSYSFSFSDFDYERDEVEIKAVELPLEYVSFSQMDINNIEHFEAYNYIVNDRKISRDIILKYRLGFCVTGKYAQRIIIPSYDISGNINYFVARNYDTANKKKKPYDNPKSDKSNIIFNDGYINYDSTVWLCEGVFEMLSFPVNTIPMLGKTIGTALFLKLKELKPDVVILLDPDAYKNSVELFYQIQNIYFGYEERVKIVKLPNNDDLDELRKYKGMDEVLKCLRTARGLTVDDYFIHKLQKPYDQSKNGRNSYGKYFEWKK